MRKLFPADVPVSERSLAGYVVLSRDILRVSDAYDIPTDRPYAFNRAIDAQTGYRTQSLLVVPLTDATGHVIGVFQLINALDAQHRIIPFDPDYDELIHALASLATVALRNAQLEELQREREAVRFVTSLATTMAHEINNPLTVIRGYIQMLARETSDPVWRERSSAVLGAVETIRESVDRLNRLAALKLADQAHAEQRRSR